ncbi:MAG: DUF4389 domain-containing protein [Pikeienuella sp.]
MSDTKTSRGTMPPPGTSPSRRPIWIRGGICLAFLVALSLAQTLLTLLTIVQFAFLLVSGAPNEHLVRFGRGLAIWLAEVTGFLTAATDARPFPFSPWPDAG